IEVAPARARADLDRGETETLARVAELVDRERRVLERHRRHAREARRRAGGDRRDVLVLQPAERSAGLRLGPVAEHDRRRREDLPVDAEPVHVLEAPGGAPLPVVDVDETMVAGNYLIPADISQYNAREWPYLHHRLRRTHCV